MIPVTTTSVYRLARGDMDEQPIMEWSCPVPYFGQIRQSKVATLGINPSNREFVDSGGKELDGPERRFPTLRSLGLKRWSDATSFDLAEIVTACDDYFFGNPYDRWFRVLDAVVNSTGSSYYSSDTPAAHLDLVPYATYAKWGELRPDQRRGLLMCGRDLLGTLLRDSHVELLVLNGRSVVREFENVCGVELKGQWQPGWDLARPGSRPVLGVGYLGEAESMGSVDLGRRVSIVGFNHNLQSSFGVSRIALNAISEWIGSRRPT